jgi:beta-mannosidase
VLKTQIETLRRLKYRPTGGFCFSTLNDSAPAISSAILDADRVPKFACDAVQAACSPILAIMDPLPDLVTPGDRLTLDVHLVSDLRAPIDFAVVDVVATWPSGSQQWRFGGSVAADDVVKVGTIVLDVPDTLGLLTMDLTITAGDITGTNHYATTVSK